MAYREVPDYHEEIRDGVTVLICDACHGERRPGDWPHCDGKPDGHIPGHFGYDAFEPYVDADLLSRQDPRVAKGGYRNEAGRPGILIESRSQRKALMKECGLQFGSNHPGGREI